MTLPPSKEQERHVLQTALPECRRRLALFRKQGDKLAAALAENDLNAMLERLAELTRKRV